MGKKLSDYAKEKGVTYRTAWNRYNAGKLSAYIDNTGHIVVIDNKGHDPLKCAIYARVSSSQNKQNLEMQAKRLTEYAISRGYQIVLIEKEIGSGVNDKRKKMLKLLMSDEWGTLIIEHKDRLTRFGFNYIESLLEKDGRKIEVVNKADDEKSDLVEDLMAVIYSFGAKLYGLRRNSKKTKEIMKAIKS